MAILLVEDDALTCRVWADALAQLLCHEVLASRGPAEAMALVGDAGLDLSLTIVDMVMDPESCFGVRSQGEWRVTGLLLAKHMRNVRPDLVIVGLTALADVEVAEWFSRQPRARLIHKPAAIEDVACIVDELLRDRA